MEKESILKDRLREMLDHYGIGVKELVDKIGGIRATYFNILNGTSKPDFKTTEALLKGFPDISSEWLMRGRGPMFTYAILSKEEVEALVTENKVLRSMIREEIASSSKKARGASKSLRIDRQGASELLDKARSKNIANGNTLYLNSVMRNPSLS